MAVSSTWDWRNNRPGWQQQNLLLGEFAPPQPIPPAAPQQSLLGYDALAPESTQLASNQANANPQPGFAVVRQVDEAARRAQRGLPAVPAAQPDALDNDEGFQRALARSGAMTIGSKRPGRIGKSKVGPTFSSGQFKGMTYDQAREAWTSRNQSPLDAMQKRTPQQIAQGSPVMRPTGDGIAGRAAPEAMDRFMRNLAGAPAKGAEGPTNSPQMARAGATTVERLLGRMNSGAPTGGDSVASSQSRQPATQPGFKSVKCRNGVCR